MVPPKLVAMSTLRYCHYSTGSYFYESLGNLDTKIVAQTYEANLKRSKEKVILWSLSLRFQHHSKFLGTSSFENWSGGGIRMCLTDLQLWGKIDEGPSCCALKITATFRPSHPSIGCSQPTLNMARVKQVHSGRHRTLLVVALAWGLPDNLAEPSLELHCRLWYVSLSITQDRSNSSQNLCSFISIFSVRHIP